MNLHRRQARTNELRHETPAHTHTRTRTSVRIQGAGTPAGAGKMQLEAGS